MRTPEKSAVVRQTHDYMHDLAEREARTIQDDHLTAAVAGLRDEYRALGQQAVTDEELLRHAIVGIRAARDLPRPEDDHLPMLVAQKRRGI